MVLSEIPHSFVMSARFIVKKCEQRRPKGSPFLAPSWSVNKSHDPNDLTLFRDTTVSYLQKRNRLFFKPTAN